MVGFRSLDKLPNWFKAHGPIQPLWQREADRTALEAQGAEMLSGITDGIIVAYPLEFLRTDIAFRVRHKNHDNNCHGSGIESRLIMHIRPSELAAWR